MCDLLYFTFLAHYLAPSLHALSSPTRLVVSFGSLPQRCELAPFLQCVTHATSRHAGATSIPSGSGGCLVGDYLNEVRFECHAFSQSVASVLNALI